MHPVRRHAPTALVLGLIAAVLFMAPSESDPGTGTSVPTLAEYNALESRMTNAEQKNAQQDTKIAALESDVSALKASQSPSPTPTATATTTTSSPSPTTTTTSSPSPTATPTSSTGWPDASNTGVPSGTTLTAYTGPLTITTANTVIDAKDITGTLQINATGVTVKRSKITGGVSVAQTGSLTISDSRIIGPNGPGTGLEAYNWNATRVHITGGNRSAYCANNCTMRDSYVHGQYDDTQNGTAHESGLRMEQNGTFVHNTLLCDAAYVDLNRADGQTAGCSAALTGYGDFAPVKNNLIQNNYFPAMSESGGTCAYGGSSAGKPYSGQARDIRFIDNVFGRSATSERGTSCGYWFTVTDFDAGRPGNQFTGNVYTDGKPVNVNASGG